MAEARRSKRSHRIRRIPILVVVVGLLVAAVVAQQNEPSEPTSASVATVHAVSAVGAPDVASTAWYCAAGTSSAGVRMGRISGSAPPPANLPPSSKPTRPRAEKVQDLRPGGWYTRRLSSGQENDLVA